MDALQAYGYLENTVVALWSDHGYHLGDTNSWYVTPGCLFSPHRFPCGSTLPTAVP
jgi:arylsulfatase A-like enzyme